MKGGTSKRNQEPQKVGWPPTRQVLVRSQCCIKTYSHRSSALPRTGLKNDAARPLRAIHLQRSMKTSTQPSQHCLATLNTSLHCSFWRILAERPQTQATDSQLSQARRTKSSRSNLRTSMGVRVRLGERGGRGLRHPRAGQRGTSAHAAATL